MKAITTRYVGATTYKPARIIASDQDGNRYVLPADGDFPYNTAHHAAAVALCHRMNWPGAESLVCGSVKHGMVWVFTHDREPDRPAVVLGLQAAAALALEHAAAEAEALQEREP